MVSTLGFKSARVKQLFSATLFLIPFIGFSQLVKIPREASMLTSKGAIICYGSGKNVESYLPPPKEYLDRLSNPNARTQAATFNVVYVGYPADGQAKTAFQRAVDIWSSLLQSSVTINVLAIWAPIPSNSPGLTTLAQAGWGSVHLNFDGAPKLNVWYPAALADKLAGRNLSSAALDPNTGAGFDIVATFNSDITWNFTPNTPQSSRTHMTTVVLHELGHGLGFTDSYDFNSGTGSYGVQTTGLPIIYDASVESGTARALDQTNNSTILGTTLTNQNITYNSVQAILANGGTKPKLYAPSPWVDGSSIAHLDQSTFSGTPNSLLKPILNNQEVTLDPGPIVKGIFSDMGWQAPIVVHSALKDTETTSSSFPINVSVSADGSNGYSINSVVKLRYSINGAAEIETIMTAGSGNQYSAQLPAPSTIPSNYAYYIVTTDNLNRTFTKPGQFIRPGQTDQQASFQFIAGPDTTIPVVTHTPSDFILEGTANLNVKVNVTDNIGVQGASVTYKINSGALTTVSMVQDNDTLSLYKATISTNGLVNGTTVSYRITATDNSSNSNKAFAPTSTTFFDVAVIGTVPGQNSYSNDFNSPTSDFFGNGYSITTPAGFNNGAIHSQHPYSEAGTGSLNFSYQLRIPIKVKSQGATIKFDEIVLVEPGEPNSVFGTDAFYDYVVTEGSTDGGKSWKAVDIGYDSRDNPDWLARYNSSIVANISKGIGDPSLFKPRVLDLLKNFKAGDEVLIRFRLFSDPGAAGWGWAIDNLKIQLDDAPPVILHDHIDYVVGSSNSLLVSANVTDATGVDKVFLDYAVNNGTVASVQMPLSSTPNTYTYSLDLSSLNISGSTKLNYRIRSADVLGNASQLPAAGFLDIARLTIGAAQNSYISDFNTPNTDFVGNFFSIAAPTGFANGAIHSTHPYPNGFGLTNSSSSYTYTLTKPITISATNPFVSFDEIGIVEPVNDNLTIEGSKDNGASWQSFVQVYNASAQNQWLAAYNSKSNGTSDLYKNRIVSLTQNGIFKGGDQVLIRFRLAVNATINAWGWAIDNLSIQGPITGIEDSLIENSFSVFPNPTNGSTIVVKFNTKDDSPVQIQFLSARGELQKSLVVQPVSKMVEQEFFSGDWPNGLYLIKAEVGGAVITRKIIKTQ